MAHAAVISLKQTLNRLLISSRTREILQLAYNHTTILQQALERFSGSSSSSERLDVLECEIRDCAQKLEDILDFHECESSELESEIASFTKRAAEMAADYIEQLLIQPVNDDDDDDDGGTASSHVDSNVKMVGRSKEFINMKWLLIERMRPDEMCLFYIVGAAGTGRTIVARTVFDDLRGDDRFFDCAAWAAIGPTYEVKEVLIDIICQVVGENGGSEYKLLEEQGKIIEYLHRILEHRRYMIVLDDVHELQILYRVMEALPPDRRNGSIVLMTTSDLAKMGVFAGAEERRQSYPYIQEMPTLMNEQCSWVPLRMNVFGEVPISPEIEEIGKKIAENCGGRRISLAKTLLYLAKSEKTVEGWRKIAADKENPIFMVGDEVLEKLEIEKEVQSYTEVQDEDEEGDDSFIYLISKWLNFTYHIQNIKMKMHPKWLFPKIIKYFYGMVGIGKSTLVNEVIKDQVQDEDEDEDEDENEDEDEDAHEDSFIDMISKWLDFSNHIQKIKMKMHPKRFFPKMQIISFYGMAGIGKSTLIKEVIKDHLVLCQFDYCVWITLGPKYRAEEILIDILAQIHRNLDRKHMKGDEELVKDLCAQLSQKKGLIVFDDIWSEEPLHHVKKIFPDIKGTALVTTRLAKVAMFDENGVAYEMQLLNKEESWCLLRQQVFGEEGFCCSELEIAGRKIAENCEGLPLLIIKVSEHLMKVEKTIEKWNNVALAKQNNSVFMNAHDEISKALRPSYVMLPQHLKSCFVYLGVFRKGYEIPMSKLTNLWNADRFLEPNTTRTIKDFAQECLYELFHSSLVMYKRNVSCSKIKTCRLHPVFWHLCNSEAVKNGFFHAINSYEDCSTESINNQRRLCIRNSSLLGMQIVHNSIASITSAHSLLCVGPPHQYPVPVNFDLRLLRVMDAITIRLYEFPVEVVRLVHLRYLSLTCNGKLPASISKVSKLQHLIVRRYINTKSSREDSSLLPVEIWDMQELEHLQIMGGCLPNPKSGAGLPKLSTLLDVSAQCCAKKVLKRIPNLKRLGIQIELSPNGKGNPFRSLNRIARLRRLESLKCVVVNPQIGTSGVAPPPPISMFPSSLKTLSLSGLGYPWEHMSIIGQLENLEVLKLKGYAFRGSKWIAGKWDIEYPLEFQNLKFLLIEDTDLMHWEIKTPIFTELERISIKHCYKLQELPTYLPTSRFLKIEIVDCNPLAVNWAQEMRIRPPRFVVEHHLSWIALQ